jgi:hypothetical protein
MPLTRQQRTCRKKIAYADKRKAKKRAVFYKKHGGKVSKPYRCSEGKHWHLTRKGVK